LRARKKKWAEGELTANELLITEPERYKGAWREFFGNGNPLHVELGCGKGRFIAETAADNPDINYIALERERQVIISGLRRARESGVKNIGFILADVDRLPELFGAGEIKKLFIFFCDPWPNRKKWAKRRLTHGNYLKIYKMLLNGTMHFKTDNRELFEFSLEQFSGNGWNTGDVTWDLHGGGAKGVMTEYEEKFASAGVPIMYCEAAPIDPGSSPG